MRGPAGLAALTLAAALLGSGAAAPPAKACSCAATPITAETFRRSDGAIVGKLTERVPVGDGEVELRYRVLSVFRGRRLIETGSILPVRTADQGSACGIETPAGRRDGLFLANRGGRWQGSLCATVSPGKMRRAAARTGVARAGACAGG